MPARSVLEGLESEDLCETEKPVKNEITDTKVKLSDHLMLDPKSTAFSNSAFLCSLHKTSDRVKRKKVEGDTGDLLRLCHTVPLEVVSLGASICVYCLVH